MEQQSSFIFDKYKLLTIIMTTLEVQMKGKPIGYMTLFPISGNQTWTIYSCIINISRYIGDKVVIFCVVVRTY
jgi:hypothetical protein